MQLYNTATRTKEVFEPLRPGTVHIYVCGITAYDFCHIGHARSAIVFDVLVRYLRSKGYSVFFIRNFTDIDDKIIARAAKENRDWREVGNTYIDAFHKDMDALGVLRADSEPRATEALPDILALCERLIASGKAYATKDGDVYFRVHDYAPYGSLSQQSLDDMRAGASERVAQNEAKEDPLDFALWKASKPGEPSFPCPWGQGRPGWHIECSAMTEKWIPLDIHGGGQDLIFPHHENEKAQTEAALGTTLARFWVHNGFVQINAEKMSKSLGNYKTIRDILETFLPETLRFFLLSKHYRSPIDFTTDAMLEAERAERRIYQAISDCTAALARSKWSQTPLPDDIKDEWQALAKQFEEALEDDLNTAKALGILFSKVRCVNRILENKSTAKSAAAKPLLEAFVREVDQWKSVLGLFSMEPETFFRELRAKKIKRNNIDCERVEKLLAQRREARAKKDFAASDALRAELEGLGIIVQDTPNGQQWNLP
ncbi:MAG: cysteine--tRNA ligase [Desulfovibrionaceae bacterium]|nr:cysteine--tRNA ligase [Desulfovibrionaceae bacterium]